MRKNNINLRILFFILLSIVMIKTNAQTGLNFQGVARTTNNVILASQAITIKLSILQGSATGTADYTETRRVITNAQGLFTAVIGDTGAISSLGNFTTINWKLTPKFLKIEMDASAGTNFITMGTTQFQYVAYAQFANSVDAENIVGIVPVTLGGTGVNSLTGLKTALALNNVNNTTDLTKPISTLTQTALDLKLNAADTSKYTKQTYSDSALLTKLKISDTATMLSSRIARDTLSLSNRINLKANISDVTTSLSLKENILNKSSAVDLGSGATSDILFPTQKAVKTYVDGQINSGGITDGGILTRHLADGAVTGIKLSNSISGYKKFFDGAGNVTISSSMTVDVLIPTGAVTSGGTSNWQSFTAGMSGKLSLVEFETSNPNSTGPAATVYVEVYSGQGLSGTLLGTSATQTIAGFGNTWKTFDFGLSNIEVLSGNVYTARIVTNSSDQNWLYGGNATYTSGISNVSSTWDHNIKTSVRQYNDDPYLTVGLASNLYGGLVSIEKGGTGATTASAARTNLGLVIGTNVQAPLVAGTDYLTPTGSAASLTNFPTFNQSTTGNATTATTAGNITATTNTTLTALSNLATVGTITSGVWSGTAVAVGKGGTGATTVSAARTNLGLGNVDNTSDATKPISNATQAALSNKLDITGNAATATSATTAVTASSATKLTTARNINGVAFDGSGDITLTADAGTLTGTTIKSTVTGSSLTSVGTITSGVWSGTAVAVEKGGTGLTATGTSGQVLTSTGSGTLTWTGTHYIGESYGGGKVFYVYDNGKHGLIAATSDQSTGIRWYGGSYTNTRARGDGVGAGLKNTAIIIAIQGSVDGNAFAATVCNEYSVTVDGVTYGDWYLPSKHELNLLYSQKTVVGGFASDYYWSSSEYDYNYAWIQYFSSGSQYGLNKFNPGYVRAIRAF
jgi:hypothetical protein